MSNAMNFSQLVSAVYRETNRPDLVLRTQQAVMASTLKMHGMDFFFKDILTAQLKFDATNYVQTLDTTTLPFYRAISYIRKDDPAYLAYELNPYASTPVITSIDGSAIPVNLARAFLKIITPDDILDDYEFEKIDVAYQVGSTIMIRSSTSLLWALAGWYGWPNCDISNNGAAYNSWIAAEFPYAIVYDAASAILQGIGMTDAARKYDYQTPDGIQSGLVASQVMALRNSNITARGY
jgi:hypothetical protein